MKQRLHITLPVFLLALALWLHSCKPESPCDENQRAEHLTYNLEPGTKEQVPYRADGLDTLVYISDAGDTATLYGQGVKKYYTEESRNRNADPDCPLWDTWSYETVEYTFTGENQGLSSLWLKATALSDRVFIIYEIDKKDRYETNLEYINYEGRYNDTVIINNQIYNGIALYIRDNEADSQVLYKRGYGLLKIQVNNMIWRKRL